MADHRMNFPARGRGRREFAIAVVAFAAAMGIGTSGAMAESQRPSKPITVRRPPTWQQRQGKVQK